MVNGKSKGSSYEREISKKLSLWLSEGKRDDLLWRTQNSGGRFTTRRKLGIDTQNQDGDITSTDPEAQFFSDRYTLELKRYGDVNLWGLLTKKGGGIILFWKQTIRQASDSNKIPILIVKQDRKPALWISNNDFQYNIDEYFHWIPRMQSEYHTTEQKMNIYFLDDILSLDPKSFRYMTECGFK